MVSFLVSILGIAVLGVLVFRRRTDRPVVAAGAVRWLSIAALVPLALQVAVFLSFGLGEMFSGEMSGAAHLLQVAASVILALLAWKRPLEGGAVLLAVGLVSLIGLPEVAAMLILVAPPIAAGALFLAAGMIARKSEGPAGLPPG